MATKEATEAAAIVTSGLMSQPWPPPNPGGFASTCADIIAAALDEVIAERDKHKAEAEDMTTEYIAMREAITALSAERDRLKEAWSQAVTNEATEHSRADNAEAKLGEAAVERNNLKQECERRSGQRDDAISNWSDAQQEAENLSAKLRRAVEIIMAKADIWTRPIGSTEKELGACGFCYTFGHVSSCKAAIFLSENADVVKEIEREKAAR